VVIFLDLVILVSIGLCLILSMVLLQTINFFNLGSKLCLVDLPGYGFAYAKEEVKDAWEELVSMQTETHIFSYSCFLF